MGGPGAVPAADLPEKAIVLEVEGTGNGEQGTDASLTTVQRSNGSAVQRFLGADGFRLRAEGQRLRGGLDKIVCLAPKSRVPEKLAEAKRLSKNLLEVLATEKNIQLSEGGHARRAFRSLTPQQAFSAGNDGTRIARKVS